MKEVTDIFVLSSISTWIQLGICFSFILFVPRFFGIHLLNGLLFAQVTLFFNTYAILAGVDAEIIRSSRLSHFFLVEYSFYVLTFLIYRNMLERREFFERLLRRITIRRNSLILFLTISLITILNYTITPTDGNSRIEYMTVRWFSYIKPLITIALPLSYVTIFLLVLQKKSRFLGYLLLLITVMASIFSGSKASFAFSLFTAFLLLKDLKLIGGLLRFKFRDKFVVSFFTFIMVVYALARLDLTFRELGERFILFGDATILVYAADDPGYPFRGVSMFTKINRGWARLFGDPSALDIDTLFGFALMKDLTGVNTFTGPNARLSAYLLSNFSGFSNFVFLGIVLLYFSLILLLFRKSNLNLGWISFLLPYCISSINSSSQDFNLIMQDITIFFFFLFLSLFLKSFRMGYKYE